MDFLGVGAPELLLVLVAALLILGPERLPEALSKLGKAYREFRSVSQGLTDQISRELQIEEWQRRAREFEAETRRATQLTIPNPLDPAAPPAVPPRELPVRSADAFGGSVAAEVPEAASARPPVEGSATEGSVSLDKAPSPPGPVPRPKPNRPANAADESGVHLGSPSDTPQ